MPHKNIHGKVIGDEQNNDFVIMITDETISSEFLTILWQELIDSFDIEDTGTHYILIPKENLVELLYKLVQNDVFIDISPSLLIENLCIPTSDAIFYQQEIPPDKREPLSF
jgi:hypothetical protein